MVGKNILFISYRHIDMKYLESVLGLLVNRTEYAIWYDDNLAAGERFDDEIKSYLGRSVVMIQLATSSYFKENSYTFRKELPYAKELGVKIGAICLEDDPSVTQILQESAPDFLCYIWDNNSVDSFLNALNEYNNPISLNEKINFYQKKINCDYITPNEMFQLAKAFADGYPVKIRNDEAIRYTRLASLCNIEGADELLSRLETAK